MLKFFKKRESETYRRGADAGTYIAFEHAGKEAGMAKLDAARKDDPEWESIKAGAREKFEPHKKQAMLQTFMDACRMRDQLIVTILELRCQVARFPENSIDHQHGRALMLQLGQWANLAGEGL